MSTISDTTPLLHDEGHDEGISSPRGRKNAQSKPTPLPWMSLLILFSVNMVVPMVFEVIYPFISQMILEIGVVSNPEDVGFYSGIVESVFSCVQLLTILPATYASDYIGRKPIIIIGMSGMAVSTAAFGLSRSFAAMVLSRALAGGLGGSWAAVRVMTGELADKSNEAVVFSGLSLTFRLGQMLGLPIGGYLAHPERHFPLFRGKFWLAYPFALPCFVGAGFAISAVIFGSIFLKETKPRNARSEYPDPTYSPILLPNENLDAPDISIPQSPNPSPTSQALPLSAVLTRPVISLIVSNIVMCFCSELLFAVYPLFAFTPIESGGLGATEAEIGLHMSIRAFMHVAILGLYPLLTRYMTTTKVYKVAMFLWAVSVALLPCLNALARIEGSASTWTVWIGLITFFFIWSICGFAWTCLTIMVNNAAVTPAALARLNGISQMAIVAPQAFCPALATALFAFSIKSGILGGNLFWLLLIAFDIVGAFHSLTLQEPSDNSDGMHK